MLSSNATAARSRVISRPRVKNVRIKYRTSFFRFFRSEKDISVIKHFFFSPFLECNCLCHFVFMRLCEGVYCVRVSLNMPAYLRCLLLNEYTKSVPMSLSSCVREDLPPRSILVWCKWQRPRPAGESAGAGRQENVSEAGSPLGLLAPTTITTISTATATFSNHVG